MSPAPEPGTTKAIIETLLKPFALIFNPIAERIGNRLRRKPKLHIYVRPLTNFWSYAWDGSPKPMMHVRFTADITNDSPGRGRPHSGRLHQRHETADSVQ